MIYTRAFPLFYALLLLFTLNFSCSSTLQSQSSDDSSLYTHEVLKDSFWSSDCQPPNGTKVKLAPASLLDFSARFNRKYDYPGKPKALESFEEEKKIIEAAITEIPKKIFDLAGDRFCGFFLARDLGLTASAHPTYDSEWKPVGGFIMIDFDRINKTANQWRTEHENLFFDSAKGKIEGQIASRKNDTQITALRWVLIHELGHIIRALDRDFIEVQGNRQDFVSISWVQKGDRPISRFDSSMPFRNQLKKVRVGSTLFKEKEILPYYRRLSKTDFPTLYAASNPDEDFSESLASYVNVYIFNEPLSVIYFSNGKVKNVFKSCFIRKTCPQKYEFFKALLNH